VTGFSAGKPKIISRGFAATQEANEMLHQLERPVRDSIENSNGNMEKNVIRTVKNYIYKKTRRKPTVLVTVTKI